MLGLHEWIINKNKLLLGLLHRDLLSVASGDRPRLLGEARPSMGRNCRDWGGLHPIWCDVSPHDSSILPHCLPTSARELWGAPGKISHLDLLGEPSVLPTRTPIPLPQGAEGTQCSLPAEGAGGKTANVSSNMARPTSKTWCSSKTKPKRAYTVWLHLYKIWRQAKINVSTIHNG